MHVAETMAQGYSEEFDASLQQAYAPRDPLAEFLRGAITFRQFRVLAEALPPDSPLARAVNGHMWTADTVILHDVSSTLRALLQLVGNYIKVKPKLRLKPLPTPFDGQQHAASAADKALAKQQRAEMDHTIARIFANPN